MLKSKGQSGFNNQDNTVFMPLRTAQVKLGGAGTTQVRSISLQVRTAEEMDLAQAQVTAILRALHGLQTGAENDFTVQNQADILDSVAQTSGTFTTLLGSIAAISLLVGGIGIMNIMLVSVTERTREVGLRKAVGAKRSDILLQFLTEAVVLSSTGGIIGVLLGVGDAQIITPLLGGSRALVTPQSIILALTVSLGIGIFFGLYPANRAARLNPHQNRGKKYVKGRSLQNEGRGREGQGQPGPDRQRTPGWIAPERDGEQEDGREQGQSKRDKGEVVDAPGDCRHPGGQGRIRRRGQGGHLDAGEDEHGRGDSAHRPGPQRLPNSQREQRQPSPADHKGQSHEQTIRPKSQAARPVKRRGGDGIPAQPTHEVVLGHTQPGDGQSKRKWSHSACHNGGSIQTVHTLTNSNQ